MIFEQPNPSTGSEEAIMRLFAQGDTLLLGSGLHIYRSLDSGNSWQASESFYCKSFVGFASIDQDLYAAVDWLIRKSSDGGLSWKTVYSSGYFFAALTTIDNTLYAMYDGFPRLIRSEDGGGSWRKMDFDSIQGIKNERENPDWLVGAGDQVYFMSRVFNFGCFSLAYGSSDRGEHWNVLGQYLFQENEIFSAYAVPGCLLVGTKKGIFRSLDAGLTFSTSNQGVNTAQVGSLLKTKANRWWANTPLGYYSSDDEGQTWALQMPSSDEYCTTVNYLMSTQQRLIFRTPKAADLRYSEDNGNSWSIFQLATQDYYTPTLITSQNAVWFYNYTDLYRLEDGSSTWEKIHISSMLSTIYGIRTLGPTIYLDGPEGKFLSLDEGNTWKALAPGILNINNTAYLDSHSVILRNFLISDSLYILNLDENQWHSFTPVDARTGKPLDLRYKYLNFTLVGDLRWIYVYNQGLYYSNVYHPALWYPFEPSLPRSSPLCVAASDTELWVGTLDAGIFRIALQPQHTQENQAAAFQIFPNPSSGAALQLSSDQFFTQNSSLRVFNVAGQQVHAQRLPPGHQWTLDLSPLPLGLYICFVQSGTYFYTLKWVKK
ncbi:MAG: T9SS type A sorting domain-containing protein [Saprospiraceae bacterium]|nr:T9SS type A sorting domain-containing protein [Saprospiraceae bacterium]